TAKETSVMGKLPVVCLIALVVLPLSSSLPFIVLHGLGDQCKNAGITRFTKLLSNFSGQEGFCIEIGDGSHDSWFTSVTKQVESVCEMVKSLPELQFGYNMVGLSQGNVIGRGVIQWCDGGPPVNNMVSLGGPHAGTASVPLCGRGTFCGVANLLIELGVYTPYVQEHLGPAGYVKIPTDLEGYSKGCKFLPKLNNELEEFRNTTYKERFSSLNELVLIMFENDKVLIPPETAWFGFYASNNLKNIVAANETDLYKDDWIGLRALDEAGKVTWLSLPGGHLHIKEAEMMTHVVPYLIDPHATV
ncbi:hypothetical protein GOP47_0004550, partial [Adiantum capillus-veneris]